jgi:uncharacterized protein
MGGLDGKTILLTGASGGIGQQAARMLAVRGARLVLVARREARLDALAEELAEAGHEPPLVLAADLGDRGQAAGVAAQAQEAGFEIDVLVNNAGASIQGLSWVAGDREAARAVFETNLWAPLALAAAVVPQMSARGHGAIVNTGSMARVSPFPHLGHYSASRAALSALTQTMRLELAPRGIRVVEVALGPVDTAGSTENRVLAGAEQWLDGRPGLGDLSVAAKTLVRAIEGPAEGVVYYPRILRWVDAFPALGRRYSRRAASKTNLTDTAIRVGGSSGSEEIRAARDAWERAQQE